MSHAAILVSLAWLGAIAAIAEPIRVSREPGAEDCPDEGSFARRVHELRTVPSQVHQVAAQVVFSAESAGQHVATIHVFGPSAGGRKLTSSEPGCAALGDAAAVSLALVFDQNAAAYAESNRAQAPTVPNAEPPSAPAATAEAAALDGNDVQATSALERRDAGPWRLEAMVSGAPSWGLPHGLGVAGVPALTATLHDRVQFRIAGFFGVPRTIAWSPGTVDVQLDMLELAPCLAFPRASVAHVSLCPVFAVGSVLASAHDYTADLGPRSQPYVAVGGAVQAGGRLVGRFLWNIGIEALARTGAATFQIQENGRSSTVFELPIVGIWAGAGLGVQIL